MINLFFSYSHKDEEFRDELEIHLSILKRQGVISTWHDRRIGAGKEFNAQISEHIEKDNIILLLVSPYFLASDYCYDIEMKKAMERHEKGEARVIPVIIHPCDWKGTPFGKLLATPTDGKPISKFTNRHDAFLEVTSAIREAAEEMKGSPAVSQPETTRTPKRKSAKIPDPDIRSSNLRIKKTFSDREKDKFLSDAFEYISNYFEGSLKELEKRNPEVESDFRRIDANHFTSAIYIGGKVANRCKIWFGGRQSFPGGIAYSRGHFMVDNSYNESLNVEDDGYMMFLRPIGMTFYRSEQKERLTLEGAAEYFWEIFIEPLQ